MHKLVGVVIEAYLGSIKFRMFSGSCSTSVLSARVEISIEISIVVLFIFFLSFVCYIKLIYQDDILLSRLSIMN